MAVRRIVRIAFAASVLGSAIVAAPALAQETGQPGKRLMDLWSGIVFFCGSDPALAWSGEACAGIGTEAIRQAEAAGVGLVVLQASGDPEQTEKLAAAAGFDGGKALYMLATFKGPSAPGGLSNLDFLGQYRAESPPGATGERWQNTFMQGSVLDPGATARDAEEVARIVMEGFFEAVLAPR